MAKLSRGDIVSIDAASLSKILEGMDKPILKGNGYATGVILIAFPNKPKAARVKIQAAFGFFRRDENIVRENLIGKISTIGLDELEFVGKCKGE